jgi:bifunctional DNA-binding transcriptional regulator/antitoxin component of YhaV-PrlF toxin-antitoxin module
MKAVKVQADGTVKLPSEIRRRFPSRSELLVWTEGDTIVLKRLRPLRATEFAERAPAPEGPLATIAAEVHRMRRAKRGMGA